MTKNKYISRISTVFTSLVLVASYMAIPTPKAHAAGVINVNSFADTEAYDGVCTLREAIIAADTDTNVGAGECAAGDGNDVINLPAGTYTLTDDLPEYSASDSISIVGAGSGTTIINGADQYVGIFLDATSTKDVGLSGITISHMKFGLNILGANCTFNDVVVSHGLQQANVSCYESIDIDHLTFEHGTATNGASSGIQLNAHGSPMTIDSLRVADNTHGDNSDKPALQLIGGAPAVIENSEISNNGCATDCFFGGMMIGSGPDESYLIRNTTISGNTAGLAGLFVQAQESEIALENVTIANNTSFAGAELQGAGLMYADAGDSTLTLENTLLDNNKTDTDVAQNCFLGEIDGLGPAGVPTSLGHNFSSDSTCNDAFDGTGDQAGKPADLGPLANNGGFVRTHALLSTSLAIDAGATIAGLTTDARGTSRPQCDAYDIGAYEYNGDCSLVGGEPEPEPEPEPEDPQNVTTATLQNAVTNKQVILNTPNGTNITASSAITTDGLPKDDNHTYPLGLIGFTMTVPSNAMQHVTLTFVTDLKPNEVAARKYHSNPAKKTYSTIPGATVTETTVSGQHALVLGYDIQDGGELDQDGLTNGSITDPVGLVRTGTLGETGQTLRQVALIAALVLSVSTVTRLTTRRKKSYRI